MQNSNIRCKVKQLLPEIGRAARARNILTKNPKYFAGTHLAALGCRRVVDLIMPYIADPRRKITTYGLKRLSSNLHPAVSRERIVVSRHSLTPEFETALGTVSCPAHVHVKFIKDKLVVLPELDGRYYFYNRNTANEHWISTRAGPPHNVLYLPCGLELNRTTLWNSHSGFAVALRFTSPNICDDFGEERALQSSDYLGECTSAFLQVTILQ